MITSTHHQLQQSQGNVTFSVNTPPNEPSILARMRQLIDHLIELDQTQAQIRERLLGVVPQSGSGPTPPPYGPNASIEEMAAVASNSAACILGEAQSILNRL